MLMCRTIVATKIVTCYALKRFPTLCFLCNADIQGSMASSDETAQFLESLYREAAKEGESPEETAQRISQNLRGFSRRDLMKAGGGVGLGALLGGGSYAATQTGAADPSTSDSDGNVGTESDPVDAWIEGLGGPSGDPIDVDTGLVPTADASYDLGSSSNAWNIAYFKNAHRSGTPTGTDRPLFSTENTTIVVDVAGGGDYTSIQEAMWNIPLFTLHKVNIQIEPGDYTSEGSILVPPTITSYVRTGTKTEDDRLNIFGNGGSNSDVTTGGWTFDNVRGFKASLGQIEIQSPSTIDNESAAISVYGCSSIGLGSFDISGTGYQGVILTYGSNSTAYLANTISFSGSASSGIQTKHHGTFAANASADFVNTGTLSTSDVLQQAPSGGPIRVEGTFSAVSDPETDVHADGLGAVHYNGTEIIEQIAIRETVFDNTRSFNSGETRQFWVGTDNGGEVNPSPGDRLVFSASVETDPGNDHGYAVNKYYWDTAEEAYLVEITETQDSGGGVAKITGWRLRV